MICPLCSTGSVSAELQTLSKRHVCIACATAIAAALPLLKTQPSRRQAICMRLSEYGVRVMPTDQRLLELAEYGVTDEQIRGACDIAKESTGQVTFGYVFAILRNERQRTLKNPDKPAEAPKAEPVKALEDWERLGFANQADYERWQWSYDQGRRKGNRMTEAESRKMWLSPAV